MTATAYIVVFVVSATPTTVVVGVVAAVAVTTHFPWRPKRRHDEKPSTDIQSAGGLSGVYRRAERYAGTRERSAAGAMALTMTVPGTVIGRHVRKELEEGGSLCSRPRSPSAWLTQSFRCGAWPLV